MEKKVLTLPLIKEWYEKVASGEKTEEYRVIKPYWDKRLVQPSKKGYVGFDEFGLFTTVVGEPQFVPYTHVLFCLGYATDRPTIEKEIVSITIGKPKKGLCPDEWLYKEFFVIKFK